MAGGCRTSATSENRLTPHDVARARLCPALDPEQACGGRPANVNRALPINFCGGPDEILAQLKQCGEQIGAGVVDLSFQTPGSEHPDELMEALELFGKKVLPHIRDI